MEEGKLQTRDDMQLVEKISSPYKEWDSLSHLLYLVPEKGQRLTSLMTQNIILKCLDVYANWMAVGSDLGIVYIINRRERLLTHRIKCGNKIDEVVKVILSKNTIGIPSNIQRENCNQVNQSKGLNIDYHIAAGSTSGQIYYMCLNLEENATEAEVPMIHTIKAAFSCESRINCFQFSTDFKALYVGEESGAVTVVSIKSTELESTLLVKNTHPIVQLNLHSQLLLVCTNMSSFIFDLTSRSTTPLGTKSRKMPASYGGCIHSYPQHQPIAYVARPGLRLWECHLPSGAVLFTHMFKESVHSTPDIVLHGETRQQSDESPLPLAQFGLVKVLDHSTLFSWTQNQLLIIDISKQSNSKLLGICRSRFPIIDVACDDGDLFILEGDGSTRRLHRLSRQPYTQQTANQSSPAASSDMSGQISLCHLKVSQFPQVEEDLALPPVMQANELKELSLSNDQYTESELVSAANTHMHGYVEGAYSNPQTENKLVAGLASVKKKLTVSSDDMKQVGQTVKLGFGNLLTKIQKVVPPRKAKDIGGREDISEAERTVSDPDNLPSKPALAGHMTSVPISPEAEDDQDLVIRFVPGKSNDYNYMARCNEGCNEDDVACWNDSTNQNPDGEILVDQPSSGYHPHVTSTDDLPINTLGSQSEDTFVNQSDNTVVNQQHYALACQSEELLTSQSEELLASQSEELLASQSEKFLASQSDKLLASQSDELLASQSEDISSYQPRGTLPSQPRGTLPSQRKNSMNSQLKGERETSAKDLLSRLNVLMKSQNDDTVQSFDLIKQSFFDEITSPSAGTTVMGMPISMPPIASSDGCTVKSRAFSSHSTLGASPPVVYDQLTGQQSADAVDDASLECSVPGEHEELSDSDEEDIYRKDLVVASSRPITESLASLQTNVTMESPPSSPTGTYSTLVVKENWYSTISMTSTPISISITKHYLWVIDGNSRVWVAKYAGTSSLVWKKLEMKAQSLSTAPSGALAWRVYKGQVYAGSCRNPPYAPWNMKWIKATEQVTTTAVDESCAWYIKTNGQVWMQSGLSKDRPIKPGIQIVCKHSLSKICSRGGVTWAISKAGILYYYLPNSAHCTGVRQEGNWQCIGEANNICDLSASVDGHACWAIDAEDIVWCITDVVVKNDSISSYSVWQVSYEQSAQANGSSNSSMRSKRMLGGVGARSNPHRLVAASENLVAIIHSGSIQDVTLCQTHILGYRWQPLLLSNFSPSSKWKQVCAVHGGKIFALYESGEVFCIDTNKGVAVGINYPPKASTNSYVEYMTSCSLSLWLILSDGTIYYSTDIVNPDSIKLGLTWRKLQTILFGKQRLRHLTVGQSSAWAVDHEGSVMMSIGANLVREGSTEMSPAWVHVDSQSTGWQFTSVHVNEDSSIVWALDSNANMYVRHGITTSLPIGTSWVALSGVKAKDLCVSNDMVWCLTAETNSLLCRVGIKEDFPSGDYWKKVPSTVCRIAVSANNVLTGLLASGQLVSLHVKVIGEVNTRPDIGSKETQLDGDWELL